MPECQLTHVALVGARMPAFGDYGVQDRNELLMRRCVPDREGVPLENLSAGELKSLFCSQLPLWIHNIIADPEFPARLKMLMPLRRFEGELGDSKDNEVVAAVLSAGFRNRELNPLDLPRSMPLRQRCALISQGAVWQEAYRALEHDLLLTMQDHVTEISAWINRYRHSNEISGEEPEEEE